MCIACESIIIQRELYRGNFVCVEYLVSGFPLICGYFLSTAIYAIIQLHNVCLFV